MQNITRRDMIVAIVVLVVSVLCYYILSPKSPKQSQANAQAYSNKKVVDVVPLSIETIRHTTTLVGVVESNNYATMTAKVDGALECKVQPGASVAKGDTIAIIRSANLLHQHELLQHNVKIAQSQYDDAAALYQRGAVSKEHLQTKHMALISAKANFAKSKDNIESVTITAPFDGNAGVFFTPTSAYIHAGDVITSIYNPKKFFIKFSAPTDVCNALHDGSSNITVRNKIHKLTHIQKALDSKTHMCPAYIDIGECDTCIHGERVDMDISLGEKNNAMVVPYSAVVHDKLKYKFVYVIRDGQVLLSPIRTGIRDQDRVEIIQEPLSSVDDASIKEYLIELKNDDKIIPYGQKRVAPGGYVKVS